MMMKIHSEYIDDDTDGVMEEFEETCLSSSEPPAAGDDCAKAMIVQLLNVLHSYSSIIFISVIIIPLHLLTLVLWTICVQFKQFGLCG